MDQKIILRFHNASKAGTTAEFPVKQYRSITVGRDPSCEVVYDSDRDDLVSRLHSKITVEDGVPASFTVSDFGSRNGTYVNRQRISGSVTLNPGDCVQLGPGGPEFEFDLAPKPVARPTRLAAEPASASRAALPTREAGPLLATVGKATVERMIVDHNLKSRSNLLMYLGAGAVSLLLMGGALLSFSGVREKLGIGANLSTLSPAAVSKLANESVVFFEVGWKLVDMETGRPLYHLYYDNKVAVTPDASQPPAQADAAAPQQQYREIVPGGPAHLPVFVTVDGTLEPLLVTDSGDGKNPSIGGRHSGSGFVVSPDGFILTNRHVASAWLSLYEFDSPVGLVLQHDEQGNQKLTPISARQFPRWVPSRARFITRGRFDPNSPLVGQAYSGKTLEGRNDYLDVTFPRNRERVQAKLIRISDQADVAMVKIDMPRPLNKLELSDTYATVAQGDPILVLGYPGVSPAVLGAVQSKEALTPATEMKVIPDPTLSVGNIGRVIRGKAGLTEAVMSTFGDVYQLTVNSTGRGNSGGPVLDDRGRVIGLFTYSAQMDALITFAVPIRYGMELMGTKPVM